MGIGDILRHVEIKVEVEAGQRMFNEVFNVIGRVEKSEKMI